MFCLVHENPLTNIITGSVLHPHITGEEAWILMQRDQKIKTLRSGNVFATKMRDIESSSLKC